MPAIDSTIQLRKPPPSGCDDILSAHALDFLAALAQRFEPRRRELLERRRLRQAELDAGKLPDFLPETKRFATTRGPSRPSRPICAIGAWRSRARWTAR